MRRLLVVVFGLLLGALGLSACGGSGSASAAKVNGTTIDDEDFRSELESYQDNELLQGDVNGPTGDTVAGNFARNVLETRILLTLIEQEVQARRLDPSSADPEKVRRQTLQRFSGTGDEAVFAAFPADFQQQSLDEMANFIVLYDSFATEVSSDAVRAEYDKDPRAFDRLCASHILVETKEEADAVLADLEGGADFATVAKEKSTDSGSAQNGGSLTNADGSCVPISTFVPAFGAGARAATRGEPSQPVQSAFGWHIILVDRLEELSFEEAESDVLAKLESAAQQQQSDEYAKWRSEAAATDIWVNPRYGSWDPAALEVAAPGETPSTTIAGPSTSS